MAQIDYSGYTYINGISNKIDINDLNTYKDLEALQYDYVDDYVKSYITYAKTFTSFPLTSETEPFEYAQFGCFDTNPGTVDITNFDTYKKFEFIAYDYVAANYIQTNVKENESFLSYVGIYFDQSGKKSINNIYIDNY